jgi:hypothetical protein
MPQFRPLALREAANTRQCLQREAPAGAPATHYFCGRMIYFDPVHRESSFIGFSSMVSSEWLIVDGDSFQARLSIHLNRWWRHIHGWRHIYFANARRFRVITDMQRLMHVGRAPGEYPQEGSAQNKSDFSGD